MAKAIAVAGERPNRQNDRNPDRPNKDQQVDEKGPNQLTSFVERSSGFLKDVRNEMRKVVTPSRQEVQTTTVVVIGTVFAFAAFFYICDNVFGHLIQLLLHWLGSSQ
jgi:preprotein translocase subunit SecE